jgi:hypothetical protein
LRKIKERLKYPASQYLEPFQFVKNNFYIFRGRRTTGPERTLHFWNRTNAVLPDLNERCTSGWDFEIISTFFVDAALPDPNERCTSRIERTLHFRT